jgi:hypothetical protein
MKNKMKHLTLNPKNAIEIGTYANGRKYLVFKCGTPTCHNTLSVGAAPCQLKRATGYCTSCHRKKRPYGVIFNRVKDNAKQKGITNSLTYAQFIEFTKIAECVYCGEPVEWIEHVPANYRGRSGYNLDRKDSSKGYSKDNCVVCCRICNWAKNELFSHEEFLLIGKTIGKVLRKREKDGNPTK